MILSLSQSKIMNFILFFLLVSANQINLFAFLSSSVQSSLNFREVLQPQSVNKFTLYVCPTSRLLKQSHEFCTQRAESNL